MAAITANMPTDIQSRLSAHSGTEITARTTTF